MSLEELVAWRHGVRRVLILFGRQGFFWFTTFVRDDSHRQRQIDWYSLSYDGNSIKEQSYLPGYSLGEGLFLRFSILSYKKRPVGAKQDSFFVNLFKHMILDMGSIVSLSWYLSESGVSGVATIVRSWTPSTTVKSSLNLSWTWTCKSSRKQCENVKTMWELVGLCPGWRSSGPQWLPNCFQSDDGQTQHWWYIDTLMMVTLNTLETNR